jgi:hypothetical protein
VELRYHPQLLPRPVAGKTHLQSALGQTQDGTVHSAQGQVLDVGEAIGVVVLAGPPIVVAVLVLQATDLKDWIMGAETVTATCTATRVKTTVVTGADSLHAANRHLIVQGGQDHLTRVHAAHHGEIATVEGIQ